ncbi:6-bladed beta-propeller [bacterium]|nr:6-bladed beta-propeller [bacterium]
MKPAVLFLPLLLLLCCSQTPGPERILFTPVPGFSLQTADSGMELISLQDFAVSGDHSIYCADSGDKTIKVFASDGRFIRRFGGEGQGPGEFLFPASLTVSHEYLYVADAARRSISQFTLTGDFIRSVDIGSPVTQIEAFPSHAVVAEITSFSLSEQTGGSRTILRLFSDDLSIITGELVSHSVEHYTWVTANDAGVSVTQLLPYAPRIVWTISGGKLYAGYNDRYCISVFDSSGTPAGQIIRATVPQRVPARARSEWIAARLELLEGRPGFSPDVLRNSLADVPFPRTMPAFTAIVRYGDGIAVLLPDHEEDTAAVIHRAAADAGRHKALSITYDDCFKERFYRVISDSSGYQQLEVWTAPPCTPAAVSG